MCKYIRVKTTFVKSVWNKTIFISDYYYQSKVMVSVQKRRSSCVLYMKFMIPKIIWCWNMFLLEHSIIENRYITMITFTCLFQMSSLQTTHCKFSNNQRTSFLCKIIHTAKFQSVKFLNIHEFTGFLFALIKYMKSIYVHC